MRSSRPRKSVIRSNLRFVAVLALIGIVFVTAANASADEPLHTRVDRLITAKFDGAAAEQTTDAAFLRRVFLDLTGRIPSAAETKQFLNDDTANKREVIIDRLLESVEFPRRLREHFDVVLMERRGDNEEWTKFLDNCFGQNKPWDEIVQAILSPNSEDEQLRGAAYFYTKRLAKYGQNPVDLPRLTRDVGRLFLGVDLQCAQCHDHIHVDDYKQEHYQGLFAFVSHTTIRRDVKFPAVTETYQPKKTDFMSVFIKEPRQTGPRILDAEEIAIPQFKKGEEFLVPPDKKKRTPGVPKFSRLKVLANQLARPETKAFSRNITNRLWWMVMGHGLVFPLDRHHGDNPATHPELLAALSKDFVAHKFDLKYFLRELVLTETYQRSSLLPENAKSVPVQTYRVAIEKPLSAEQLLRSMLLATGRITDEKTSDEDKKQISEERDKKLAELRSDFVTAFGAIPKEPEIEFAPSVKAALFVMNNPVVLELLKPQPGNLVDRLSEIDQPDTIAKELYLTVLSRMPSDDEKADVIETLKGASETDRARTISLLVWSLLASNEFCLNH